MLPKKEFTLFGHGTANSDFSLTASGSSLAIRFNSQAGQRPTFTAIDRATNTLTISPALTWSDAQGVGYSYRGTAPDIGAVTEAGGFVKVLRR